VKATIDVISTERNVVGNLVGTYNDLAELMVLAQTGRVTLHTRAYPLDAVDEAMDDLDAGRLQGRGILVPAGASRRSARHVQPAVEELHEAVRRYASPRFGRRGTQGWEGSTDR
jgi:hypothetical protein